MDNEDGSDNDQEPNPGKTLPWIEANKMMNELKLPVYVDDEGNY